MESQNLSKSVAVTTRFALACGLLDIPTAAFSDYEHLLDDELTRYAELALSARFDQLGLTTMGAGEPFVLKVASLMAGWGFPEDEVHRFQRTVSFMGPHNVFTQLEVDTDGAMSFRWYLRRRPTIDRVCAVSLTEGDDVDGIEAGRRLAEILQKGTVHFYSRKMSAQATSTRMYFSQYARDPLEVRNRIREAAHQILGRREAFDPAIGLLRLPPGSTAFLGATLGTSGIDRLKLTTPGFPAPDVLPILDLLGEDPRRLRLLAQLELALDTRAPTHLAVDATADAIDRVKLYYRIPTHSLGTA